MYCVTCSCFLVILPLDQSRRGSLTHPPRKNTVGCRHTHIWGSRTYRPRSACNLLYTCQQSTSHLVASVRALSQPVRAQKHVDTARLVQTLELVTQTGPVLGTHCLVCPVYTVRVGVTAHVRRQTALLARLSRITPDIHLVIIQFNVDYSAYIMGDLHIISDP